MADEVVFTIDTARWGAAVQVYAERTGIGIREALDEEWPLLISKIIDFTPPNTLAQGRAAVASDIRNIMRPFDPIGPFRTEGLREIVEKKDIAGFNILAARDHGGLMSGKRAVAFDPLVHTSQRNKYGRVTRKSGDVVLGSDAKLLKQYVKNIQDRVGWAKAGWLRALALVGAIDRAPAYVSRHDMSGGDVIDDRANEDDPSITAINHTPWANRQDEGGRIIVSANESRRSAIISKIRTKLRLAAQAAKFN